MKTIFLIRHAKSSWGIEGIADIDRPLNDRGYLDAYKMAGRLKKFSPSGILVSSPAIRAVSTALIFSRAFESDSSAILIHPLLYESGAKQYLEVISALPDEFSTAFLFGHNPVITATSNLIGGTVLAELPTTGIVGIEFDMLSWKKTKESPGRMVFYDFPKNTVR